MTARIEIRLVLISSIGTQNVDLNI